MTDFPFYQRRAIDNLAEAVHRHNRIRTAGDTSRLGKWRLRRSERAVDRATTKAVREAHLATNRTAQEHLKARLAAYAGIDALTSGGVQILNPADPTD
ncbi:hypothetical protein [Streptomyces sp. NPDC096033]|uniref:hypothetical protein n=1 Tax=Streptomyces sp. NPDC096033 TaxID=3366071 RepID=UPI0037FB361A